MAHASARVIVVGGGILGAATAYHLAQRGASVTLLEAGPSPAAGATGKSWAWLNANRKRPAYYRDLNIAGMQEWHQYPQLACFCGTLILDDARTDSENDYPSRHVPPDEVQLLEPNLSPGLGCSSARLYPTEGWVDPVHATNFFVAEAVKLGAQLHCCTTIERFQTSGPKVTGVASTSGEVYTADYVILAAGTGIPALSAKLGIRIPLLDKPAVVVLTTPLPRQLVKHMVIGNGIFILQRADGRCLLGETHPSEGSTRDTSPNHANQILQQAALVLPALKDAAVDEALIGYRPYPADGHPILGWMGDEIQGVYVAVTHSGMTLGPLLGQHIAQEVLSGPVPDLQHYRPHRKFSVDKAYG